MSEITPPNAAATPPVMNRMEFIAAALVLLLLIAAQLIVTRGRTMLQRTPWLDEVHTAILVADPDPARFRHATSDQCVDLNFPVYYWPFRWAGITSLAALRMSSLLSTGLALLGLYALLRGSFGRVESAVGVLTVWASPLVVYHALQARFYAPWFAAVVCFALALRWEKTARFWPLAAAALAVTSVLACTLHGFGLPAIVIIAAADLWMDGRPMRRRLRAVLPALAGPIAVAAFIPTLIAQRQSYVLAGWLVGHPGRLFYSTVVGVLPGVAAAIVILGAWVSVWSLRRRSDAARDVAPRAPVRLAPLAGISALLFFPLVLLVVSLTSQPALLSRYALITSAAIAPAAAYAATRMRPAVALVVCVVLVAETGAELVRQKRGATSFDAEIAELVAAIRARPDLPALFESRHQLFPVVWTAPDLRDRAAYLDFEPGPDQLDPIVEVFERDVARKFERLYGWPKVMPWEQMLAMRQFVLVPLDDDPERVERRFPQFTVERLRSNRYALTRR